MLYLALAGVYGLFLAWGIGAKDVANAMATIQIRPVFDE